MDKALGKTCKGEIIVVQQEMEIIILEIMKRRNEVRQTQLGHAKGTGNFCINTFCSAERVKTSLERIKNIAGRRIISKNSKYN